MFIDPVGPVVAVALLQLSPAPMEQVRATVLDRYQLALDAIKRIPRLADQVEKATARYWTSMEHHKLYISEHGDDLPEVRDWRWSA